MKGYKEFINETSVVRVLDLSNKNLMTVPVLPDTLQELDCSENKITSLPELPVGLKRLYCHRNKLTTLPKLPDGLVEMYCYNNPLECLIPTEYIKYQNSYEFISNWLENYYKPYIRSYEGQKKILTDQPDQLKDLLGQTNIHPKIKKEFYHLFTGMDLNLL